MCVAIGLVSCWTSGSLSVTVLGVLSHDRVAPSTYTSRGIRPVLYCRLPSRVHLCHRLEAIITTIIVVFVISCCAQATLRSQPTSAP